MDVFFVAVTAPPEAAAHQHVVIVILRGAIPSASAATVTAMVLDLHAAPQLAGVALGRHRATAFSGSIWAW